jgi:hypothetical protein
LIRGRFRQGAPVVDCFIAIPAMGINSPEPITLLDGGHVAGGGLCK